MTGTRHTVLYCDSDQEPIADKSWRSWVRTGTVMVQRFTSGGAARVTLPMAIGEAIEFFDPFQERR